MNCYVKVYGCQMNAADAHLVSRLLDQSGISEVGQTDAADAVVLLTCSVRQHAEDRAAGFARTMRGEGKKVIIAGCMGRLRGSELIERGFADHVLGPDDYRHIPSILLEESCDLTSPQNLETYADLLPAPTNSVTASLAVMRGCNNYCAYCVVPYARGSERSLPYPAIERQVKHMVDGGAREIFLLGQNVLAYRHDDLSFINLLEQVSRIPGVQRLAFLTSHPRDLTIDTIRRMSVLPDLLHFFHLPLQSGSDSVLERMGRGYSMSGYEEKIAWVREVFPDVYMTTDLMVGFPGESETDYLATVDAVNRIGFDFAYMFAYSERPGTSAALMPDQVPVLERKRRLAELIQTQNAHTRKRAERMVGVETEIFVVGPAPRGGGAMLAEMKNYRSVILKKSAPLGKRLKARLVGLEGWSLVAEPVAKEVA